MTAFASYLDEIQKNLAHGDATEHTHRPALKMNWNEMHIQSRQVICWSACLSESFATKPWEKLEKWVQMLLADYVAGRSNQTVQLSA
jgi:hypothetical protein